MRNRYCRDVRVEPDVNVMIFCRNKRVWWDVVSAVMMIAQAALGLFDPVYPIWS